MKQCPKCGEHMTWYCTPWYGTVITGWKCPCGYDTIHNVRYTWSTDTVVKGIGNDKIHKVR